LYIVWSSCGVASCCSPLTGEIGYTGFLFSCSSTFGVLLVFQLMLGIELRFWHMCDKGQRPMAESYLSGISEFFFRPELGTTAVCWLLIPLIALICTASNISSLCCFPMSSDAARC
jgi:hypothetical protein